MADPRYKVNDETGQEAVSFDDGKSWYLVPGSGAAADDADEAPPAPDPGAEETPEEIAAHAADGAPTPAAEPENRLAPDYYDARPMPGSVAKPFTGSAPAAPKPSPAFGYSDAPYDVGARNPWEGAGPMAGLGYALGGLGLDDVERTRMAGRSMNAPVDPRSQYEIGRDTELAEQDAARAADGFQYGLGQGVTELAATSPLMGTPFAAVPAANAVGRAAPMGLRAVSAAAGLEGMGFGALRSGLGSRKPTAMGQVGDTALGATVGLSTGAATPAALSAGSALARRAVAPLRGAANEARSRMLGAEGSAFSNVARRPGQTLDEGVEFASDGIGAEAERRYGGGMQSAADYARKSGDELDVIGMSIDDAIQRATKEVPDAVPTADFVKQLRANTQAKYAGDTSEQGKTNFAAYKKTIDGIAQRFKGKKYLSPADLQQIKANHARAGYPTKAQKATPEGQAQLRDQAISGFTRRQLRNVILGDGQNPGLALPETQRAFEGSVNDYRKVKTIHDLSSAQATKPAPRVSASQMMLGGMTGGATGAGLGFGMSGGSAAGAAIGGAAGAVTGAAAGAVPSAVRAKLPSAPAVMYRGAEHAAQRVAGNLDVGARAAAAGAPMAERLTGPAIANRLRQGAPVNPAKPFEGQPSAPPAPQSPPVAPKPVAARPQPSSPAPGNKLPQMIRVVLDSEPEGQPLGDFTGPLREAFESGDESKIAVAIANVEDDPDFRREYLPYLVEQQ